MRALVLAVTLSLALSAHATPDLEFFTERTTVSVFSGASVFLDNAGDETAHDVVIRVDWDEELTTYGGVSAVPLEWECETQERFATCRVDEFGPDDFAGVFFTLEPRIGIPGGHYAATATLTTAEGGSGTIVFDVVSTQGYAVTNTNDSGPGSLRAAIEAVNANPVCGTDVGCSIAIGSLFTPPMTIAPLTPLPPIRKCNVAVSGYDDFEFPLAVKRVAISGENAGWGNGLEVRASCAAGIAGVQIRSLVVHSWPWNGIHFESPEPWGASFPHTISQVYVGTDLAGLIAKPNRSRGINVDSPHDRLAIYNSIVSGNVRSGVAVWQGRNVSMLSTKVGVNRNDEPLGNGAAGFFSQGVPFQLTFDTLAYNAFSGLSVMPGTPEAYLDRNAIYGNANLPIDWNIDDRTPADDETDGILNAPQLIDAYYDDAKNITVVRGVVRLRAGAFGGSFGIYVFRANSLRGDAVEQLTIPPQPVRAPLSGVEDVEFEFQIGGAPRGTLISAMMNAGVTAPTVTSEISEAIRVR